MTLLIHAFILALFANYGYAQKVCTVANQAVDCNGAQYTGTCDSGTLKCVCATGYVINNDQCKLKPATPTFALTPATAVPTDLSAGATYTFTCVTTTDGVTVTYLKDNVAITNGELSNVAAANDGDYKCRATLDGVNSDDSSQITITVGASGKRCTLPADCTGAGIANSCEGNRCGCLTNFEPRADTCSPSGKPCTQPSECTGTGFVNSCPDGHCDCSPNYERRAETCSLSLNKPSIALPAGVVNSDLSQGATYILTCTLEDAPDGTTFTFKRGTTTLPSGTLTNVAASNNGAHTCKAVLGTDESPDSDPLPITVNAAGKRCTIASECSGDGYAGTCPAGNRCACGTGYFAYKLICSRVGTDCSADSGCSGAQYNGKCESSTCTCATNFIKDAKSCIATGKPCTTSTASTDCTGPGYDGTCPDSFCNCNSGYEKFAAECRVKPAAPTLGLPTGAEASDLSAGATYTLTCTLTGATDGTSYKYFKDGTELSSGTLTSVATADHAGVYTCKSVLASVYSDDSNSITLIIGAVGKRCTDSTVSADCTGDAYAGTCTSNRCDCKTDYEKKGDQCKSGAATAVVSVIGLVFAFVVSKLF